MADLSPFLSTPQQWVEKLALLRGEREKIEAQEDRLRDKLRAHLESKNLDRVEGDTHIARLEKRESTDFSQTALRVHLGDENFDVLKRGLPKKTVESLVLREIKKTESPPSKEGEIAEFFGATEKKKEKLPWQK